MKSIKQDNLNDLVVEAVKDHIQKHNLQAGDKLPSQKELSDTLEIGSSSVREGLRKLEGMGVLVVQPGKGSFVKNEAAFSFFISQANTSKTLLEMLEVRRTIELKVIELAILRATNKDIDNIEERLVALEEEFKRENPWPPEDYEFHQAVYRCCKNDILHKMINEINNFAGDGAWNSAIQTQRMFYDTFPLHRQLYNAVKNRDVTASAKVTNQFLDMMEAEIRQ